MAVMSSCVKRTTRSETRHAGEMYKMTKAMPLGCATTSVPEDWRHTAGIIKQYGVTCDPSIASIRLNLCGRRVMEC
eukprot:1905794-Pleurochrysis_carterae.AAC.1